MMKRRLHLAIYWLAAVLLFSGCLVSFLGHKKNPKDASGPRFETEGCRKTYEDFFDQPSIEVRVVFGYKDARPARFVADRYERMIFIQRILQACRPGDMACGFTRSQEDSDLFEKEFLGPDQKSRKVVLRVLQSSAGADDEENRSDPFQKWRSRQAMIAFTEGLARADVVLYNGHSRGGGGPDFEPPKLTSFGGVNFESYRLHEPGFSQVVSVLEGGPSPIKLLGLYSCASTKHFLTRVQAVKPDLGLVTSPQLIYFSDALETSLETLSSLLGMKCEERFQRSLRTRAARNGVATITGFFR